MNKDGLLSKSKLGQVWTPSSIASDMVEVAFTYTPNAAHILDPACGPATFSSAIFQSKRTDVTLVCYDIDPRMVAITENVNKRSGFRGISIRGDYLTDRSLEAKFDLVIMNPPYVRHEELELLKKNLYHQQIVESFGKPISKRSNLFIYFLFKSLTDLKDNGILCAIVYDSISQTKYGRESLELIERHAELLHSKKIRTPFEGAIVDAQILVFRKRSIPSIPSKLNTHTVKTGYTNLETLLKARRGTPLPNRKAFLAEKGDPFYKKSSPFFIKQSSLSGLVIRPDKMAYLSDSPCQNDKNFMPWFEKRATNRKIELSQQKILGVTKPILFNYYIRNNPRHLWNPKKTAVSDNFYASETRDGFPNQVAWLLLNSDHYNSQFVAAARNQGNGLKKLQLFEYRKIEIPDWRGLSQAVISKLRKTADELVRNNPTHIEIRTIANKAIKDIGYDKT